MKILLAASEGGLTLELTRAEHAAFKVKGQDNDGRDVVEASRLNELLGVAVP